MTRRQYPEHRLGFSRAPYPRANDVQRYGQWIFLQVVAQTVPDVLATLGDVAVDDPEAVRAWARRWHISDDWCLAHAHSTLRLWTRYPRIQHDYWADRDDLSGFRVPDESIEAMRPLKTLEHFDWLVRYQVRQESFAAIASADGRRVQTAHGAVITLARLLGLSLRPSQRGRPRTRPIF